MAEFTRIYRPENRNRCLLLAAALTGIVALVDWRTDPFFQLGFLYLFPVALAAGFLVRWQILSFAVACALMTEVFSSLGPADAIPRILLESLALAGTGLFVSELVRNRQLALEHVKTLEDQIRLRREAEEQFHVLVETSPAAILIVDQEGRIVLANESAQRLLATQDKPLAGQPVAAFLPDLDRAARVANPRLFRTTMQCWGVRADQTRFPVEAWFSTYISASGPRLAAILADLSEELESESGIGHERILEKLETMCGDLQRLTVSMASFKGQFADQDGANAPPGPSPGENTESEAAVQRKRLTEREVEVLRLVFEGLTNKEIAGKLSVSESSIKATLQQLFAKAEVRTRSQLVRAALDQFRHYL